MSHSERCDVCWTGRVGGVKVCLHESDLTPLLCAPLSCLQAQATPAGDIGGVPERRAPPSAAAAPGKQQGQGPNVKTETKPARKPQLDKLLMEISDRGLGAAEGPRQRHRVVRLGEQQDAAPAQCPAEVAPFKSAEEELGGGTKRRSAGAQTQAAKKQRTEKRDEQAEAGAGPAAVSTPTPPGGAPVATTSALPPSRQQRSTRQKPAKAVGDTESEDLSGSRATLQAARPPKAKAPGKRGGVVALLAAVAEAPRSGAAAGQADAPRAEVTLHGYSGNRAAVDPHVKAGTQPTLWCDVGTCAPGPLLRGSDPAFWGALRSQGAVVVKVHGAWDVDADASAIADLSWILRSTSTLKSMKQEYQHIKQAMPRVSDGLVVTHKEEWGLKDSFPFGALLDEVKQKFQHTGQPFMDMSVSDREATFLELLRTGRPMEFPYLQGLTLAAHGSSTKPQANGLLRAIPEGGAHLWETSSLPVVPGSILTNLLKSCEAVCNRALRHDTAATESANNSRSLHFARRSAEDLAQRERVLRRREKDGLLPVSLTAAGADAGAGKAAPGGAAAAGGAAASPDADLAAGLARSAAQMDDFVWGAGIVSPWLYFMGLFSVFGAHIEDCAFASARPLDSQRCLLTFLPACTSLPSDAFGSANAILSSPDSEAYVIWYSVPREQLGVMHEYMQQLRGDAYTLNCLEERHLWIDPRRVEEWNATRGAEGKEQLKVFRHVQGPGEYVVTDYGSVHWGVNLGVGWKSAVNFGCEEWRAAAEQVDGVYTALEAATGQRRHDRTCPRLSTDLQAQAAFQPDKLRAWAAEGHNPGGSEALAPLAAREAAGRAAYDATWARLNAAAAQ